MSTLLDDELTRVRERAVNDFNLHQRNGDPLDLSPKESRRLIDDTLASLRSMAAGGGPLNLAREITADRQRAMEKHGVQFKGDGLVLPLDTICRALTASSQSAGGALVGTDVFSVDTFLRPAATIGRAGAIFMTGVERGRPGTEFQDGRIVPTANALPTVGRFGDIAIPVELTKTTMSWTASGAAVSATDGTWRQTSMTPNRLSGAAPSSNQLLTQTGGQLQDILLRSIRDAIADAYDRAAFQGGGVAGEPMGIFNNSSCNLVTFGAAASLAKVVSFEKGITTNDGNDQTISFVANPNVREKWKQLQRWTNASIALWGDDERICGKAAYVTTNVAANNICAGDFSKLVVAIWGEGSPVSITVDRYSLSLNGQTRLVVDAFGDIALLRPTLFTINADSAIQ